MSDTEQEFDITNAIALGASEDESELEDSSAELQDEILDSDSDEDTSDGDEDNDDNKDKDDKSFPALELEDDSSSKKEDVSEYFASDIKPKKLSAGTFAGLGLSRILLNNVTKKGFKTPTPIQRKAIPFVLEGRDVVGMARTGSGKTAAFVLPMLDKLKVHSAKVGARALILSPSRELALQTLKVIKDFSRGTDLRSVLLVGGDSLDEQFGYMMSNPDIIIATPGRFLHLKVEMQLDLKTIEYVVFDEADRLFEMGFAEQLNEILASLSTSRQSLLFSATLPKSLVEFAKAGLQDPVLVRLDSETKISEELEMAFFTVKDSERDAALNYVLRDVIKMPPATEEQKKYLEEQDSYYTKQRESSDDDDEDNDKKNNNKKKKKRRERLPKAHELPSPHSTIVFVPTKHHVEYISMLLKSLGYAVSYIYGSLDQTARKEQLYRFRAGKTSILVVTDVAARGIDVPVLANVINYCLPPSPKVFVHRVGRTARAGRRGWAYSLVRDSELPYLIDLELFLGRKLLLSSKVANKSEVSYVERMILGTLPREGLEDQVGEIQSVLERNYDLTLQHQVAIRGEQQYVKTRPAASQESVKRSKEIMSLPHWDAQHCLFGESIEAERQKLLDAFANRRSKETVFEYKKTQFGSAAELMARRRKQIAPIQKRAHEKLLSRLEDKEQPDHEVGSSKSDLSNASEADLSAFKDADELAQENLAKSKQNKKRKQESFRDEQFFMSHYAPSEIAAEKGYSVGNSNFADAARGATFDLQDEGKEFQQKQGMRWDKKKGKYVNAGSENGVKYIRGEGGTKIPASFRSGRFDEWKAQHKVSGFKVGAMESTNSASSSQPFKRFKHHKEKAPKMAADKYQDDYHRRKKQVSAAVEKGLQVKGAPRSKVTSGLNDTESVRKQRQLKEKRREKNARPSKRKKK